MPWWQFCVKRNINMNYEERVPNVGLLIREVPVIIRRYPAWLSVIITSLLLAIGCLSHGVANAQVIDPRPPVVINPVPPVVIKPVPSLPQLPPPVLSPPLDLPRTLGSGNGGDRGNPPGPADIYVLVACSSATDGSDECQRGVAEATEAITDSMAEEAAHSVSRRILEVHFTAVLDRAEQLKALKEMEDNAIATTELRLNHQLMALLPFPQPLPPAVALAAITEDERALNQINRAAREEADTGQNWSHQWPSSTHRYESNVYNKVESWQMSPVLKHEYECAGAGHKPGCNWDGRKDSTLYTKQ